MTHIEDMTAEEIEEYLEKQNIEGYFDSVTDWEGAIDLMSQANESSSCGWSGRFVELDGAVFFRLCMYNEPWRFTAEDQPLLSDEYLEKGGRKGRIIWEDK